MSVDFSTIPELPLDEAYRLTAQFKADDHPQKVLLGAGVYRDEKMKPWILPSVKEAKRILHESNLDHEYLPIQGNDNYLRLARDLAFSFSSSQSANNTNPSPNIISIQTISGTGANHLGALFLAEQLQPRAVWISDPTWANHHLIWETAAPRTQRKLYPYYDAQTGKLDYDGMVKALQTAQENDVVLLHACAHNPTGIDLTRAQWEGIAEVCVRRRVCVFFDCAYQGFASGDVEVDGWAVRYFEEVLRNEGGLSMCLAQSFAKSFGLYGERAGAFHLVMPPGMKGEGARSRLLRLVRSEISTCPLFGARVVETILGDERLKGLWYQDLRTMADRIKGVRTKLRRELEALPGSGDWAHLETQIGMFSYTGLSKEHVKRLAEKHHVYLMESGRASLSGVNDGNVKYVAQAFNEVLRHGKLSR